MNKCGKIGLGTVQWGMPYGITNSSGIPSAVVVGELLASASRAGVRLLDTAWAYGNAETVLGEQGIADSEFAIVTKTRPIKGLELMPAESVKIVKEAFRVSLSRLRVDSIYCLLIHHADDLLGPSGDALWALMQEFKLQGVVEKIGCSLYCPDQYFRIQDKYQVELVQLPYNIYDQRFVTSGMADHAERFGVEVHVRSAFLQGVLLKESSELPVHFDRVRDHHAALWAECKVLGLSPLQAALGFCLACQAVDKVIVGCERQEQWDDIVHASAATLSIAQVQSLNRFAIGDDVIMNPSRWK